MELSKLVLIRAIVTTGRVETRAAATLTLGLCVSYIGVARRDLHRDNNAPNRHLSCIFDTNEDNRLGVLLHRRQRLPAFVSAVSSPEQAGAYTPFHSGAREHWCSRYKHSVLDPSQAAEWALLPPNRAVEDPLEGADVSGLASRVKAPYWCP